MAQILIRNLDKSTVDFLKARAKANGRSLQAEVKLILEQTANIEARRASFWKKANRIREELEATGRDFGDSVEILREIRN